MVPSPGLAASLEVAGVFPPDCRIGGIKSCEFLRSPL